MKRIIGVLVCILLFTAIASAEDATEYKGDVLPSYKVIVSSWRCHFPWGIWSSTQAIISDDTIEQAGFPVWPHDWLVDNQGDGTDGYDVWEGTGVGACRTIGDKETYKLQHGIWTSVNGRCTGKYFLNTLQNTTNETTVYIKVAGKIPF